MKKQNLIMGIIDNYEYSVIKPFFDSLKKSKYEDHVCIFTGPNISQKTEDLILSNFNNAEIIKYQNAFPFIKNPHVDNFKELPEPIHIYNFRHYIYYNYLLNNEDKYANVLLTDIRDVVFQKDPFDFAMEDSLYVAMENTDRLLATCVCNSNWILNGYNSITLEEIGNQTISCAGTTIGPIKRIKTYLFKLLSEISHLKDAYNCADQAVHNVLLHRNQLSPVKKLYDTDTPILTIGTMHLAKAFKLNKKGEVTDLSGNAVNIIHQYDKHYLLNKIIMKNLYGEKFYYINRYFIYLYLDIRHNKLSSLRKITNLLK